MKIGEFLSKCNKEEIPFYLYRGNNGYKIPCVECDFFKPNDKNIWQCNSFFFSCCQQEFAEWLERVNMPNEH